MLVLRGLKKFLEMFVLLEKKVVVFFFFFIEGKIKHWILLISFSQSDAQVFNSFLNV